MSDTNDAEVVIIPQRETDWSKCCLCQKSKKEDLRCPANYKRLDYTSSYITLADNLIGFQDIHSVPLHINLARLDDGTGIANTLVTNSARYHKSCYTACNSRMLDRAGDQRQRKISNQLEGNQASGEPSPKKTRSSLDCAVTEDECILCSGKYDGLLIRATSDDIDVNLKQWAHTTHNYQLVAKLDGAKEQDLHSMNARYHKGCYTKLYTQARAINTHSSQQHCSNTQSESLDAIAIAQLVAYLDAFKDNIHKLSDLVTLYT